MASAASPCRGFLQLSTLPAFLGETPQGPARSTLCLLPATVGSSVVSPGKQWEPLDGGVALACASLNGVPLEFHVSLVGGKIPASTNLYTGLAERRYGHYTFTFRSSKSFKSALYTNYNPHVDLYFPHFWSG